MLARKLSKTRRYVTGALLAGALTGLAACGGMTGGDGPRIARGETVVVGMLLPKSAGGAVAGIARDLENAAQLAVADLDGVKLELRVFDTGGTPEGAAAAARQAVDGGAKILLGPLFFGSAVAASTAVIEEQVNVLTFSNNTDVAGGNVFLLGRTFENSANRLAQFSVARGQTDVMIIHANDAAGAKGRDAINAAVAAAGGRVVDIQGYPLSQQGIIDRAAQIAASAGASRPDALFLTADASSDLPLLLTQLPEAGLRADRAQYYGLTQWNAFAQILDLPGANGGIFPAPDVTREEGFRQRFNAAFGNEPHVLAPLAYDGIAAIGALVGTGRADALTAQSLTTTRGFQGASGAFRLLPNGTNERALALYQVQDGRVVMIDPAPTSLGGGLF